jgi:divalent metal cation (Fe/Co/Zn/Cd) transporter
MSLKVFHIVFISLSVVLAFGFGLWLLVGQPVEGGLIDILAALFSFGVGILLVLYEIKIVKKFRSLKSVGVQ